MREYNKSKKKYKKIKEKKTIVDATYDKGDRAFVAEFYKIRKASYVEEYISVIEEGQVKYHISMINEFCKKYKNSEINGEDIMGFELLEEIYMEDCPSQKEIDRIREEVK